MSQDQTIKDTIKYLLNTEFKVNDKIVFRESEEKIQLTIVDDNTPVHEFTGYCARILKLIMLRAPRGIRSMDKLVGLFEVEKQAMVTAHIEELEETVIRMYAFLIAHKYLENRRDSSILELGQFEADEIFRIGSMEGEIKVVGLSADGAGFSEDALEVYASGTMTACSSY